MTTMALAMLCNSFIEASYIFTGTSNKSHTGYRSSKVASQAFAFIQGTGLEIIIQEYGLDYNAEELREKFNNLFHSK